VELDAKRSHVLSLALPEALGAFLPVSPLVEWSILHPTKAADGRGTELSQGLAADSGVGGCWLCRGSTSTS